MPTRKATPSAAPLAEEDEETRHAVARLLKPLDLVLLTRERIQATLDDAVERGRMTRADATDLAGTLFERGRRQTEDLIADVEQLLGRSRDQLDERSGADQRRMRDGEPAPADRMVREVDRARRTTGVSAAPPVPGYDELTAAQVTGRLVDLTPAELREVRDYEKRNANRKSVLAAVEQKLA